MKKVMRMLGFRIQGACDVALLCTMKAFEIEDAAFSAFRPDGSKAVSKEYTEKLIRLHNELDPSRNPILCARYLMNKISSEELVKMPYEEMIFQSIRDQKLSTEATKNKSDTVAPKKSKVPITKKKVAGLRNSTSTCHDSKRSPNQPQTSLQTLLKKVSKTVTIPTPEPNQPQTSLQTLLKKVSKTVTTPTPEPTQKQNDALDSNGIVTAGSNSPVTKQKTMYNFRNNYKTDEKNSHLSTNIPSPPSLVAASYGVRTRRNSAFKKEKDTYNSYSNYKVDKTKSQLSTNVPPPPSLVTSSLSSSSSSNTTNNSRGILLRHNTGDRYNIAVSDTKANFQAKLYIEEEFANNVDDLLPSTIKIKRRSRVDEYTSFISLKLRSGNSTIILLRMSICGKSDEYRRFYKDYESKKRIAMCKLGEDTLFLVTPKFHSACKDIRDKLSSRSSSYGVLVKRLQFNA
mmetsp:Transcript_2295/g.2781  ORF Transcript_2295/g.2781 Transcript_2295/m.2781 type:complete len:457 (+) Transcript_2295:3-1373(+)